MWYGLTSKSSYSKPIEEAVHSYEYVTKPQVLLLPWCHCLSITCPALTHSIVLQAEKSLTPTQSQATPPTTPQTQPKPKRPTAEVMEELRKAQVNGKSEVPVDANGNNVQDIMKELIGNVVQEAMPQLMQQMGTAETNPIMQVSPGMRA